MWHKYPQRVLSKAEKISCISLEYEPCSVMLLRQAMIQTLFLVGDIHHLYMKAELIEVLESVFENDIFILSFAVCCCCCCLFFLFWIKTFSRNLALNVSSCLLEWLMNKKLIFWNDSEIVRDLCFVPVSVYIELSSDWQHSSYLNAICAHACIREN